MMKKLAGSTIMIAYMYVTGHGHALASCNIIKVYYVLFTQFDFSFL
jgi:hypothetical protein